MILSNRWQVQDTTGESKAICHKENNKRHNRDRILILLGQHKRPKTKNPQNQCPRIKRSSKICRRYLKILFRSVIELQMQQKSQTIEVMASWYYQALALKTSSITPPYKGRASSYTIQTLMQHLKPYSNNNKINNRRVNKGREHLLDPNKKVI